MRTGILGKYKGKLICALTVRGYISRLSGFVFLICRYNTAVILDSWHIRTKPQSLNALGTTEMKLLSIFV